MGRPRKQQSTNGATLGFEATLWAAADKLRGHMDAAEYKHVVLGLIFLKYISDAFEERHAQARRPSSEQGADPEDPDEYRAESVFWVPPEARWSYLQAQRQAARRSARSSTTAMDAIERENPSPQGRAAEGLRPPGARQAAARRADRPDRQHRLRRRGDRRQGRPRPRLRVLPRPVRQRRGQARRRVLHAALASSSCSSR